MNFYTALQPTGKITLGNYIGSLKNYEVNLKNAKNAFLSIADLHSLTTIRNKDELQENIKELLCIFFALDLHKKTKIFIQSHIPAHAELTWILLTITKMGELERMTQYKDKKSEHNNVGLFTYPVLMASDILLYDTNYVPVGIDQKQHLELAKTLANRFNYEYKTNCFIEPQPLINKNSAKIYSLTEPVNKMSKSDSNPKSYILLTDDEETIRKKIKSATTDSVNEINFDREKQPGVSNLITIYSELENISIEDATNFFKGQNYGFLKNTVADSIIKYLKPIQEKINYYQKNFEEIEAYLAKTETEIKIITDKKIKEIYEIIGLE